MDEDRRLATVAEIPTDGTFLVTLETVAGDDPGVGIEGQPDESAGDTVEVILTRLDDGSVVAFRNYCQHWTDAKLDRGDGALVRNDQLVCQKHGATFDRDTGYCDFGPCEGAILEPVAITVEDGIVSLADDDYRFLHEGGTEPDVDDLSSRGRIGFDGA